MSWYRIYQEDPEWLAWYRREFDRKLGGLFEDPEDVCSTAIYKLLFEKLPKAKPRHKENMHAFVRAMFRNVLEDTRRSYFGRPRVPTKMKLIGPPIDQIYFAFCLMSKPIAVIAAELRLGEDVTGHWVTWLKENNKCPQKVIKVSLSIATEDGGSREMEMTEDDGDPVGDGIVNEELVALIDLLLELNENSEQRTSSLSQDLGRNLDAMREAIDLSDEERLLIRLRFVEQLSVPATAKTLGNEVHTVRNREKQLITKLSTVFRRFGVTP